MDGEIVVVSIETVVVVGREIIMEIVNFIGVEWSDGGRVREVIVVG